MCVMKRLALLAPMMMRISVQSSTYSGLSGHSTHRCRQFKLFQTAEKPEPIGRKKTKQTRAFKKAPSGLSSPGAVERFGHS